MICSLTLAVLTTVAQVNNALHDKAIGEPFDLNAIVRSETFAFSDIFAISDDTGSVIIQPNDKSRLPSPGHNVRLQGRIKRAPRKHIVAGCEVLTIYDKRPLPEIQHVSSSDISSGSCDANIIRTTGVLRDYFCDEIDPRYLFLILNDKGNSLYVVLANYSKDDLTRVDSLIGHVLTVTGLCDPNASGYRRKIGRIIRIASLASIADNSHSDASPANAPILENTYRLQPTTLHTLGRRRAAGRVIAVWQGKSFLLQTSESLCRIDLAKSNPPRFGDAVEIIGFPETDLFQINFSRSTWKPAGQIPILEDTTIPKINVKGLLTDTASQPAVNVDLQGQCIQLRGTVRSLPSIGNDGRFYLESDGYTLPVDISANPVLAERLEIGSVVDVTGVCVMDIENWRPNLVFPHIKEVMIVTRTPDDIVIIRRPPWWTPARLMIVIGSLLAALLGILIWNRALKALAEKRGKALANEELERLESDLKVCERTRLAVELHDSIAQNLTGVSMEIDTALRGDEPLPPAAAQHMGRALRTIDSCRGELRNCLWDLRSQALEEDDMNKAIRLTLSQTIGKANLSVRFNVPRSRFTDNTAHTLLRIIRELAANAVRHGHATEIKVAGSIEDNVLKFSVRDNGCGFDPDACPDVLDGHFGLQGVRERVASFEGNIRIESALGKGTRVSVSINTPQTDDKEKI